MAIDWNQCIDVTGVGAAYVASTPPEFIPFPQLKDYVDIGWPKLGKRPA